MTSPTRRDPNPGDPVKEATVGALQRLLDPLLDLMFDAGVTVQEFNRIARDRAVRIATRRLLRESGRGSKSRVAIMTGLPRSEVTRILSSEDSSTDAAPGHHPARRVLAAWHDDPKFLGPGGEPAVLPIFGKKRSFEHLVERYGMGIPVRAMLDELMQLGAVERLDDQKVGAKSRVPVMTGLTVRSIAAVGERGRDLLETLAHNVRFAAEPYFEATAVVDDGDPEMATVVRREIREQAANFINGATSLLNRSQPRRGAKATPKSPKTCRLGVTVYYFQDQPPESGDPAPAAAHVRRKNLRRRRSEAQQTESE
jgi:hypothetical protein